MASPTQRTPPASRGIHTLFPQLHDCLIRNGIQTQYMLACARLKVAMLPLGLACVELVARSAGNAEYGESQEERAGRE